MEFKKKYYLITLLFSQIIHGNYRKIYVDNKTNLPVLIKQLGADIFFCGSFSNKSVEVYMDTDLDCFVGKRKHRGLFDPIKLVPSVGTIGLKFYREANCIVGECIIIYNDYSSEEI